jgi:hypothetical protein
MKYFQEFKLSSEIVGLIKKYKVQNTLASNMADDKSYALALNTLETINKIENALTIQIADLKNSAEEAIENIADEDLGITEIHQIEIQTDLECFVNLKSPQEDIKITTSNISKDELIENFLEQYPECMWVIKEVSPLFSKNYQDLVVKYQYYNYLINL